MFPDPLSRSEIAAQLRPILLRCDQAGRRYIVELATLPPVDQSAVSPELRRKMLDAFWQRMGELK